jgi:hypothetical protein
MRSLFVLILEKKFKFNQFFLNGIWISRRVARIPVSGEILEIPGEKKILGHRYRQVCGLARAAAMVGPCFVE